MELESQPEVPEPNQDRPPTILPELDLETGMLSLMGSMSIWELAHRWVGADPMTPNGSPIPTTVQPPLRALSRAVASREIPASHVVVYSIEESEPGESEYVADFGTYPALPVSSEDILGILSCSPDRKLLDSIYVPLESVFHWVSKYPPAKPGALGCEPLEAAGRGR
jgi:hypothetical protein